MKRLTLSHAIVGIFLLASCNVAELDHIGIDDITSLIDGPCPAGMVHINDFCIDKWEARLQGQSPFEVPESGFAITTRGVMPQGYISGEVAELACEEAGKRLCTSDEWLRACQGPAGILRCGTWSPGSARCG